MKKILASLGFFFLSAASVYAEMYELPGPSNKITNPIEAETIPELLTSILEMILQIGVPIVTLMIILVGFKFVVARGNPGEITKAKESLKWTLIGAAIVLGAFAIAAIIRSTVESL